MDGNRLIATERLIIISKIGCENQIKEIQDWAIEKGLQISSIQIGDELKDEDLVEGGKIVGITLGGDGTFLEGVRLFAPNKIPFVGVGLGTLSFLANTESERILDALEEITKGRGKIEQRQRVEIEVDSFKSEGLNEVVIGHIWPKKPTERKISCINIFADGEYMGKYEGTGVAVTTPTGSTGLSLSAGGPIHHPHLNKTVQLTPLHTHTIGVRPVVFGADVKLEMIPETEVYVLVDGGRATNLIKTKNKISITGADIPAYLIKTSVSREFFSRLEENLGWGLRHLNEGNYENNKKIKHSFEEKALELAKNVCMGSGDVLRELHRRDGMEIFEKENGNGPVTEADYLSEKIITSLIRLEFPDHDIVSEETVWEDNGARYKWVIDPLDGTGNFIHSNPNYSISVALLEENEPIIGVIYIPEIDQLYSARRGGDARVNGNKIQTTDRGIFKESMLITGHDPDGEFKSSLYSQVKGVRRYGSAAINLAYLAQGSADIVWEWDTSPWDVAAGVLLVKCAGGKVTDKKGEDYKLNFGLERPNELIASNGQLHEDIIAQLE
tara:strand:- start:40845 stop:42509 length:1665 start_codon:yes stop_codon:yes gene_type:complete